MTNELTQEETDKWYKQWKFESQDALESADSLFESKKYHHALFFSHLAVEKILKAVYVKKYRRLPLLVHDLILLSKKADLDLTEEQFDLLIEINSFNIRARYDDYKQAFYKKATKEFASVWIQKCKDIIADITKEL